MSRFTFRASGKTSDGNSYILTGAVNAVDALAAIATAVEVVKRHAGTAPTKISVKQKVVKA